MRVVTWNCRRASSRSTVWDYLLELAPDIALLQEVCGLPPRITSRYAAARQAPTSKRGTIQRFSSAVLVRGQLHRALPLSGPAPWVEAELQRFAGNLMALEVQPVAWPRLKLICVYSPAWPLDRRRLAGVDVTGVRLTQNRDVWVGDLLWAALSQARPLPGDPWIIGGDFNLCETFDGWRGGPRGNREYLDRLAHLGLVECLRHTRGVLTPTYRTASKGTVTAQLDYLFVTDSLRSRLVTCDVGARQRVFEGGLSDHLPIVADFD